jgi:hypothetical protein
MAKTAYSGRMKKVRVIFVLPLIYAAFAAAAHVPQDGDVYATFGSFAYRTHTLHHDFESPVLYAPGLVAEGDLDSHGGLEISMFYLRNVFSVQKDGRLLTERIKRMYITTGYRHWFSDNVSIAGAFFSSYTMGEPTRIRDDFGSGEHPPISTSDTTEYGLEVSGQCEPWHQGRFAIIVDARYAYSLTAKRSEDSNHYGVLVGVKYFVQSREKPVDAESKQ